MADGGRESFGLSALGRAGAEWRLWLIGPGDDEMSQLWLTEAEGGQMLTGINAGDAAGMNEV